jgi:hypothetical protein
MKVLISSVHRFLGPDALRHSRNSLVFWFNRDVDFRKASALLPAPPPPLVPVPLE